MSLVLMIAVLDVKLNVGLGLLRCESRPWPRSALCSAAGAEDWNLEYSNRTVELAANWASLLCAEQEGGGIRATQPVTVNAPDKGLDN